LFKDDIEKHAKHQQNIVNRPRSEDISSEEQLQREVVHNLLHGTKQQYITLLRGRGIQDGSERFRRYLAIWEKYGPAD